MEEPTDRSQVLRGLSPYSLLSSLTLLYAPADWYDAVGETVLVSRTEMTRRVDLRLRPPDDDLGVIGLAELDTHERKVTRYYVPLLTPRKHVLVDTSELHVAPPLTIRSASHSEHVKVSEAMIRARVASLYLNDAALSLANRETIITTVTNVTGELVKLVDMGEEEAQELLEKMFPGSDNHQMEVLGLPRFKGMVPADLNRLFLLCKLMSERYLKLLVVEGDIRLGLPIQIGFTHRERFRSAHSPIKKHPFESFRMLVRESMGASPSSIRVPAPWARRTDHYRVRFAAPEGMFFHEADFMVKTDDSRELVTRPLHEPSKDGRLEPSASKELGGGSEAYMLLSYGSKAKGPVDVGFTCYEMPPGSTGYAFSTTGPLALLILVLYALVTWGQLEDLKSDVPAVIVALAASAPAIASPFMPRAALFTTPVLTRIGLIAAPVAGYLFALWLIASRARAEGSLGSIEWALGVYRSVGGWLTMLSLFVLGLWLFIRMVMAASKFNKAREANYVRAAASPEHT